MDKLDQIFSRANTIEVEGCWYYDIGEYQFNQFAELAKDCSDVKPDSERYLRMSHWYGPSYLVPVDLVMSARQTFEAQRSG